MEEGEVDIADLGSIFFGRLQRVGRSGFMFLISMRVSDFCTDAGGDHGFRLMEL